MPTTMTTEGIRQRLPQEPVSEKKRVAAEKRHADLQHPSGVPKHGAWKQGLRMALFAMYFNCCCFAIAITQYMGVPLYWYNQDYFYTWMAVTKEHFGLVITTMTHWWAPVKMVVSGDESVRGQLKRTEDGRLECDFPERMVLMANHQIYTDWIYLWWIAYTSKMHGHIYIILKESIKYIPVMGSGMMFYGFIFLSRKWATDKERFQHRLRKLSRSHPGPMFGTQTFDPMWLLIFPEGTNLSDNGRVASKKWADKNNIPDLQHTIMPRSTGLHYCLSELRDTTEWMYDCTVAYEGVPRGEFGQDLFTLRGTYFQGRQPKSVNMYWRRFAIKNIPTDEKEFGDWLLKRWREKDDLIEHFIVNGRFPADNGVTSVLESKPLIGGGLIETEVRPKHPLEFTQIFAPPAALLLIINVLYKIFLLVTRILRMS